MERCLVSGNPGYKHYGGRGITICERWRIFENFLVDMGERPNGKTLDRFPDQDGNYEPGNCRWATVDQQNRNRRDNVFWEYQGEKLILADWAKRYGIHLSTVQSRTRRGMPLGEALTKPLAKIIPKGQKRRCMKRN